MKRRIFAALFACLFLFITAFTPATGAFAGTWYQEGEETPSFILNDDGTCTLLGGVEGEWRIVNKKYLAIKAGDESYSYKIKSLSGSELTLYGEDKEFTLTNGVQKASAAKASDKENEAKEISQGTDKAVSNENGEAEFSFLEKLDAFKESALNAAQEYIADPQKISDVAEKLISKEEKGSDKTEVKEKDSATGKDKEASSKTEEPAETPEIPEDPRVSASSVLKEYYPANVLDEDPDTAWFEGADGDGTGEYLVFNVDSYEIYGITILPGYMKNSDVYEENCVPEMLLIQSGREKQLVDISDFEPDFDTKAPAVYKFEKPLYVSTDGKVKVTIVSVQEGTVSEHAGISELQLMTDRDEWLDYTPPARPDNGEGWIYKNSNSVYLNATEISHLSDEDLQLAINEIYARHGYKFRTPELVEYFDSQDWYEGTVDSSNFDEKVFSEIEKYNLDLMKKERDKRG